MSKLSVYSSVEHTSVRQSKTILDLLQVPVEDFAAGSTACFRLVHAPCVIPSFGKSYKAALNLRVFAERKYKNLSSI